jgi:hypothetical protein
MTFEEQCDAKRAEILRKAQKYVADGIHYLWGAGGQIPSPAGPVKLVSPILDGDQIKEATFCAAVNRVSNRDWVCTGRFRHADVKSPFEKVAIPAGLQPNETSPSVKALRAFIDRAPTLGDQYAWNTKSELTPRRVLGDVKDYGHGEALLEGAVVWGESCNGVAHFDCGHFVQKVVREVCGTPLESEDLRDFFEKQRPATRLFNEPMYDEVNPGNPMRPADILVYRRHYAFAISNEFETFRPVSRYKVVQAESATFGGNFGKIHKGESLLGCVRLSGVTLLNRPSRK